MINKENSLCFSGHRRERLPKNKKDMRKLKHFLSNEIDNAIKNGIYTFYFGACYGFDLMCADIVLKRRIIINLITPVKIKLIAVVPFEKQALRWSENDIMLYNNILKQCDNVIKINKDYKNGCYFERNRYMVDHSGTLICYYNGGKGGTAYTVDYAKENNLKIINLYNKLNSETT